MCDISESNSKNMTDIRTMPVTEAVGMVIAHDITEIRPGEFKGRAFKKGHIVRKDDIGHLQRLGKENLFIIEIKQDEVHENDAACAIAEAVAGSGVRPGGEPEEGKINLVAETDGLFKVNKDALLRLNMLGEVMCATIHTNSVVRRGQILAGTRAIPLVVKKSIVDDAVRIAAVSHGILSVKRIRRPKAGIVITGSEVYYGKIEDAFKPVITKKIIEFKGEVVGVYYAPDDAKYIESRIRELISAGADLIITTGGMSVDPDDMTRFAIRNLGVEELVYGSPVLPGSMFLIAYVEKKSDDINPLEASLSKVEATVSGDPHRESLRQSARPQAGPPGRTIRNLKSEMVPILGIPACGMYSNITILDMILPRVLASERIGREELAELGHGGLCLKCKECRYPLCPFGK